MADLKKIANDITKIANPDIEDVNRTLKALTDRLRSVQEILDDVAKESIDYEFVGLMQALDYAGTDATDMYDMSRRINSAATEVKRALSKAIKAYKL